MIPVIHDLYWDYFSTISVLESKSLIQKTLAYWIQIFSQVSYSLQKTDWAFLFPFLYFIFTYYLFYRFAILLLRSVPGVGKYIEIKNRLNRLNERIEAAVNEETNPFNDVSKTIINVSFGNSKRNKNYPLASAREIESELIFILKLLERIKDPFRLKFIIIFDELDKIDPEAESKGKEESGYLSVQNSPNGFSSRGNSLERKENVLRLLANMKHFITVARAKFIFISGRELYDAYLAGLSDREFAISSVFNEAIYVESFLTSNRSQMDVVSLTEQYICKMLLPRNYMRNVMKEKYIKYGIIQRDMPSLKWYYIYLRDQLKKENKNQMLSKKEELRLDGAIMFLRYFSIYLTHISNGSPQKISSYFKKYVRTQDDLLRKGKTYEILGINYYKTRKPLKDKFILTFNYVAQRKIAFIYYMAYPMMQAVISNMTQYGDKLLVSASFLMNHIYKYHSYGFSWRNLEQAPELLQVYRTPELRNFINSILSFMVRTHMATISAGLYQFKFRSSIREEISIFSKFSEEISAIFNFTLDESSSIKQHYDNLLKTYTTLLNESKADQAHYHMILSRLHQVVGDLRMMDEEYLESSIEFRNSIAHLMQLLPIKEFSFPTMTGDVILPLIRNMLKLGLSYERRRTNNSAYVIYYELVCRLIDFRRIDESKLGLEVKVKKTQDWRDREYILYRDKKRTNLSSFNMAGNKGNTDTNMQKIEGNYVSEIQSQLLENNEEKNQNIEYELHGDELISELARLLTPEKALLIVRLSLLEDLRLVYQAILAKLFVLEKVELGGINKANIDVSESEFRYLYRATNMQDKFIILVDFFRNLADILYYKNGLINKSADKLHTGLYFWGYEFTTDVEEYCANKDNKAEKRKTLLRILNDIEWKDITVPEIETSSLKSTGKNIRKESIEQQWQLIKNQLKYCNSQNQTKEERKLLREFLQNWEIEKSFIRNIHYQKVERCNLHRKEMLEKGFSLPCFACRYYTRSLQILSQHLFKESNVENSISKVLDFLYKTREIENTPIQKECSRNFPMPINPTYLSVLANTLDGMGNVQVSCADGKDELTAGFLEIFGSLSANGKEKNTFDELGQLTVLEKAILYYWTAARFYKKGASLKDASVCLKKILYVIKYYIQVEENLPEGKRKKTKRLNPYVKKIVENISHKSIMYLYAQSENVSLAEIQDIKGIFSLKPYEDISLEKISLYPDIEEIVLLLMEIKIICKQSESQTNFSTDEKDDDFLKLYRFNMSSVYHISKSLTQTIRESHLKAKYNFMLFNYLLNDILLISYSDATKSKANDIKKDSIVDEHLRSKKEKEIEYDTFAPLNFFKRFNAYMKKVLFWDDLEKFGILKKECGIKETNGKVITNSEKLQLLEFLIEDSMFCLQRALSILTTNSTSTLYTPGFIAETYRMMFEWAQIFKFIYFMYEYMEVTPAKKHKICDSLLSFINSRLDSEANEPKEKISEKIDIPYINETLSNCEKLIKKSRYKTYPATLATHFYKKILNNIDQINRKYIISNYPAEMAIQYYRKAKEMHQEGNAYKEMIANMYYLDDDLQNDTVQFNLALERYLLNCNYISTKLRMLKDIYHRANIYKAEWYETGGRPTPLEERNDEYFWPIHF